MAADTAQKRASIVSIGFQPIGPGIVPSVPLSSGQLAAIGYSYAFAPFVTAGFIVIESAYISVPNTTATIEVPSATATIRS